MFSYILLIDDQFFSEFDINIIFNKPSFSNLHNFAGSHKTLVFQQNNFYFGFKTRVLKPNNFGGSLPRSAGNQVTFTFVSQR